MPTSRKVRTAVVLAALSGTLTLGLSTAAYAVPPNIPDLETAKQQLGELTVQPDGSQDGYDRDKFPHWNTVEGECNVREQVLQRDGENVQVGDDCRPTSGTWNSVFDGVRETEPDNVNVDHMIPLAEAWRTGAREWTEAERETFANDQESPQLIAVTSASNSEKSDKGPEEWKPVRDYWCDYSKSWIAVKHKYQLTTDEAEKAALEEMLAAC